MGVKCDPSEEDDAGTWKFGPDENTLTITAPAGIAIVNIDTLNETNFVYILSYTFGSISYNIRRTFSH